MYYYLHHHVNLDGTLPASDSGQLIPRHRTMDGWNRLEQSTDYRFRWYSPCVPGLPEDDNPSARDNPHRDAEEGGG